jgi:hypothetical protein
VPTHRADRFGQAQPFVVEPFEFARFDLAQGGPAFEQSRNSLVSYARCVTHAFRSEGGEVLGEFTDHAQRHTTRLLALNKRGVTRKPPQAHKHFAVSILPAASSSRFLVVRVGVVVLIGDLWLRWLPDIGLYLIGRFAHIPTLGGRLSESVVARRLA